ncbi:zinc knuckle CX2CX4HX4C containing protein [Tanacetum coccineum]
MINVGSIDLDVLKSRISQLKGNESGNAHSTNSSDATRVNLVESGVTIDVAATFGVPLTNVGDLHKLISDIEAGKHGELLSGMTNDDRIETLDALEDLINLNVDESTIPSDPIVQSVDINTKSTSYAGAAGASAKDQSKVHSNFCTLVADPVFDGVNISIPHKVVKNAKHGLKRIMMNSKGFFFFKFDSRAGLDAILESGPWLIRKSPVILKKWSMDTRLLKEELTRIPIWVKLHDVPILVFKEDGISLIATFIGKPVNSKANLVDVVTIGIPSLSGDGFTKETIRVVSPHIVTTFNVVTPTVEKTNDGFQTVGKKKKRKGKSKSTNGGQFDGSSIKQNVRYEPKAATSAPKNGVTNVGNTSQSSSMLKTTDNSSKKDNLSMYNSFSALNDEEEDDKEDVENVYDESANLIQNPKAGGSSSFTAAAG